MNLFGGWIHRWSKLSAIDVDFVLYPWQYTVFYWCEVGYPLWFGYPCMDFVCFWDAPDGLKSIIGKLCGMDFVYFLVTPGALQAIVGVNLSFFWDTPGGLLCIIGVDFVFFWDTPGWFTVHYCCWFCVFFWDTPGGLRAVIGVDWAGCVVHSCQWLDQEMTRFILGPTLVLSIETDILKRLVKLCRSLLD